jgi:hypothetical protein
MLWPLGAVLHNLDGLLLAGMPIDAENVDALQIVPLEFVGSEPDALHVLEPADTGEPALDLNATEFRDLLDLPFTTRPKPKDSKRAVDVHVRFDRECVPRIRNRLFHRSQRAVLRTDGTLDMKLGPVELDAAASWAASFGQSVRVLGNKKLRKTVKKRSFSA